jgi:methylglutaconyl-CoA hydratase
MERATETVATRVSPAKARGRQPRALFSYTATMTTPHAMFETVGGISTLTLNRPDARNALSLDLLASMHQILARVNPAETRVLVITGAGKAFCAGMDLKAVLADETGRQAHGLLSSLAEFCLKLRSLPVVSIAAVNGAAIGGGCGLSTVCDFSITYADNKMGFPEVDLGVCPAVVAPWLVRKIGAGRARAILLRGGLMSGAEAHATGLVNECVATREELDGAVQALVKKLVSGGPAALAATKSLLNQLDGSLDAAIAMHSADLSASVLRTTEAQAMLRAKLG